MYALTGDEIYRPKKHLSVNSEEAKVSEAPESSSEEAKLQRQATDKNHPIDLVDNGREFFEEGQIKAIRREAQCMNRVEEAHYQDSQQPARDLQAMSLNDESRKEQPRSELVKPPVVEE